MKVTGIVTEYNPFHYGHLHHLQQTRVITGCDVLVNVMSGNFVQRGEPAVCDKWIRAKTAVEQGCDLVLELPYPYVVQRGDIFAAGAVETLKLAGINALVFGSETNDLERLTKLAETSYEDYKEHHTDGVSFAKAMEQVHGAISSNDILGISYIKALKGTGIIPYTIQRTNGYHDHDLANISSATAIRKALDRGDDITAVTPMADELYAPHRMKDYYPYLQSLLSTLSKESLKEIFLVDEGIESLLVTKARSTYEWEEFLDACISRRYARSSIQRTLTHILTATTKQEINVLPPLSHIRVLAFNDTGKKYLKTLKEKTVISSRFNQIPEPYRSIELRAAYAYAISLPLDKRKEVIDRELQPPVYVRL